MSDATQNKIASAVKHYAWGCFAKSWNGAIAAIYSFLGLATGAAFDPEHFDAPGWRTLAWTFLVAFGVSVIGYFKDHPLPPALPDTEPPFPPPPFSDPFAKLP